MTKTLSLSKFIAKEAQKLEEERRDFFLNWLANHTRLEKSGKGDVMEKELNTWFYSLSIGEALEEHQLILAEIKWCAKVPIKTLRKIVLAERPDSRRCRNA